ncbi:hypothetical protein EV1_040060 [Malus domestica]
MLDSSAEETDGLMVLCSNCKTRIVLTEPNERPSQTSAPRQPSKAEVTHPNELGRGQRQKVFDRLGPQERTDGPTLTR